jgi:4-amino-4-deoxy-L-arabinose transferase-like glycosyltransferase
MTDHRASPQICSVLREMTIHSRGRYLIEVVESPRLRRCWPVWLWGLAALGVAVTDVLAVRVAAGLVLLCFLPGWALVEAWLPTPREVVWRVALAGAVSTALTGIGTLYLVYLSVPLTPWHILAMCATITWPNIVIASHRHPPPLIWPDRRTSLVLLAVLFAAAILRLTMLGYAEFHEDEVEVVSLAARAIKGEGYAVFLHRKGPLQMLLPLASWLLAGRITEGAVRLPFAIASLLGVVATTWLAYRIAGRPAALAAGVLIAINGYLVAFGRMVQYQSLVFLLASVAFVCLWQAARSGDRYLIVPAALCTATSLLAHFDALVFVPVTGCLVWWIWRRWPHTRLAIGLGVGAASVVCLSFYVPYLLDAQFAHTAGYLLENRVGSGGLYNNLGLLWSLDSSYASRFYQPLLVGLVGAAAVACLVASGRRGVWLMAVMGAAGTAMGIVQPGSLDIAGVSLAIVPWLMLVGGVVWALHEGRSHGRPGLLARQEGLEAIVLWWAVPAAAYLFLVGDPRTHLYVVYPAAAVLAGSGAEVLWRALVRLRPAIVMVGAIAAALIVAYQVVIFLLTETDLSAVRSGWKESVAGHLYGRLPGPHSYFGYPSRTGWKAVGALMARGVLPDDFRSVGIEFSVPVWYAFETPRSCYEDAALYLLAVPVDGMVSTPQSLDVARYARVGTVTSEGRQRLELWQKDAPTVEPVAYDLAELAPVFDALATPDRFGRLEENTIAMGRRFGDVATLLGFRLTPSAAHGGVLLPGKEIGVRLTWLSLRSTETSYRAFVHLGEDPVWAQQDEDPACRLPMPLWRAGQRTLGQFRLSIPATIPPGPYPLTVGLYDPATMQRLPVTDEDGQSLGDAVLLATVQVGQSP